MSLVIPTISFVTLYVIIIIVFLVLKNKQKPGSEEFKKYDKILNILLIIGVIIFAIVMAGLGAPLFF